jgi:thiamine biosynthesis protein ThiS
MTETMEITVNGERRRVDAPLTVGGLLALLEMPRERIAVERNRRVVRKGEWDEVALADGDTLEVVHFVGGG